MSHLYAILIISVTIVLLIPIVVKNIKGKSIISDNSILTLSYVSIVLFVTVTIATYSFLELITLNDSSPGSHFEKWEKALEVAAAFTGFISLIVGFKIWQDGIERQHAINARQSDIEIFNLFMKFRTDFDLVRRQAWKVRLKWRRNEYRALLVKYYFNSSIIDENKEINVDGKKVSIKSLKDELRYVRDIFEFYSALIVYKDRSEKLVFHRLFFYDWWRPFLYEFAEECDKHYDFPEEMKNLENFNYEQFRLKKSYVNVMHELDQIFGFVGLDKNLEFIQIDK